MITPDLSSSGLPLLDELTTEDFLQVIGQRVRQHRSRKSMSRKRLAEVSTVSERYLAQLESGQGNMSIALLRKVTTAIGVSLCDLLSEEVTETCARRTSLNRQSQRATATPADGANTANRVLRTVDSSTSSPVNPELSQLSSRGTEHNASRNGTTSGDSMIRENLASPVGLD